MNHSCIDFIYNYLSRTEASNIDKVCIEYALSELVQKRVLVNKKRSQGDSPQSSVNSLHSDLCFNNELTIMESVNSDKSTTGNNTPSTQADIQTPLATNENLS